MADDQVPERPLPPPTWRDVLDRFVPPDRAGVVRFAAGAIALVVVAGVTWWALRPPPAPAVEETLPYAPSAAASSSSTSTTVGALVVHAAGAVVSPGVHRLPAGSRVADLLVAAGGSTADADLDRVNLAAPLADGQRVWFPRVGEQPPPEVNGGDAGADAGASSGPLDLNTATAAELEELPGIGPTIAAAIVEHRERNGPFGSVDDLLDVPGIGPSRLEELRDLVTV